MDELIEMKFIEKNIYRKKVIFEYLLSKKKEKIQKICELIGVSNPTLYKDIKKMNQLYENLIGIKTGTIYLNLKNEEQTKFFLHKLYENSNFLKLLYFYLFNKARKKNIEMPISSSKFYSVKSQVVKFLKVHNLKLNNGLIVGSRLKINWIKTMLNIKYGFHQANKNAFIYHKTKEFIQDINKIENCYLTEMESQIFFNHLNFILNDPDEVTLTKEEENILPLTISPPFLENKIKNLFNVTNTKNKNNLLKYVKLCYFLLNTHSLSPKVKSNYKNTIIKLLLDSPEVSELIYKIEKSIEVNIKGNEIALSILYNHLKPYVLNWSLFYNSGQKNTIIDDNNQLIQIFDAWNKQNNLEIEITFSIINSLFQKLMQLKSLKHSTKLYIYTDSWSNYIEISTLIKNKLPIKIPLVDHWISSKEEILNQVQPKDIIISDDYFFSHTNKHQNNIYLPVFNEVALDSLSKKIIDCLINA